MNPDGPITPAQNFWQNVHGIGLTILWCLGADTLLIIVRYCRNWHKYLLLHSLFGVINILTIALVVVVVVLDSGYLFNSTGFAAMTLATKIHFIFGMSFIFIIVGIQALGLVIKSQLEGTQTPPDVLIRKKRIHKVFGYSFYTLSKVQLVLGWYVPGPGWATMMTILLVYYVLFFGFKFFFLERLYINQSERIYYSTFREKSTSLVSEFQSVAEMVQNGVSKKKIRQEYPDTEYVIFKDKLYDVSGITHPGGNYIISHVIGEEISRYLYGAYSYELTKAMPHKHTIYAHKMLGERYACDLDLSKMNLLNPIIGERVNVPAVWTLKKSSIVSKGTKCFLFQSARYRVNGKPNILYLGRHFLMNPHNSDMPPRLYTLTLCMSPTHKHYLQQLYGYLETNPEHPLNYEVPGQISELPFVIKEYKVGGLSQHLHALASGGEVTIQGPFGRGLELEEGNFYAFCGGTGVLPLLDLIYQILLEVYRRISKTNGVSRLPPDFRLVMYLSVNTNEDLEGLDIIPKTYKFCQKYKLDLFQLNLRVSKGAHPDGIPKLASRLDEPTLRSIVKDSNITTALVCGSPEMNFVIGNVLMSLIDKDRVHVL